jgi:hypothetical protein
MFVLVSKSWEDHQHHDHALKDNIIGVCKIRGPRGLAGWGAKGKRQGVRDGGLLPEAAYVSGGPVPPHARVLMHLKFIGLGRLVGLTGCMAGAGCVGAVRCYRCAV